uniref:Uncharacterized protein n=1 Tax=Rhizophora mucronata TaxID=61149 RepID=A0A2P2NEY7_RHIMU
MLNIIAVSSILLINKLMMLVCQ